MNPAHLVDLAAQIAQIGGGKPRQATLKRAVSTAYYALFHALCWRCARAVVGETVRSPRFWEIVTPIYRAVDHGTMRRVMDQLAKDGGAGNPMTSLGRAFLTLHTARIAADYDPAASFSRAQALDLIAQASTAIGTIEALDRDEYLLLAVRLLAKSR